MSRRPAFLTTTAVLLNFELPQNGPHQLPGVKGRLLFVSRRPALFLPFSAVLLDFELFV